MIPKVAHLLLQQASEASVRAGDPDPATFTSAQMLELAVDAEAVANICGPFDPAYEHYVKHTQFWFQLAQAKEIIESMQPVARQSDVQCVLDLDLDKARADVSAVVAEIRSSEVPLR